VQEINKILIIQTAFLGDVILTTPLVAELKNIFPHGKIDFLTIPKSINVLENNPDINEIIVFDKRGTDRGISGLYKMGKLLKKRKYDLCISPHRSLRSAYLSFTTGAETRIGFDRSTFKSAFNQIVVYRTDLHEIQRNLSLLESFKNDLKMSSPRIFPTEDDKKNVDQIIIDNNINLKSRIFALAPGSIWPTKRWPESYYADICNKLASDNYQPVLIGGPEDIELCDNILKECQPARSLAGQMSLRQSTYFLTKCVGLLTNDSAPLHIGMAAGIPVYSIFGATVPEFGFAPIGVKSRVIEYKDLACRPCGIHGGKKCPTKTFDCMVKLTPDKVYDEIGIGNL
jgi:heptosyltransferase II